MVKIREILHWPVLVPKTAGRWPPAAIGESSLSVCPGKALSASLTPLRLVFAGVALVPVVVGALLAPVERALVVLAPAEGQEIRMLVVRGTAARSDQVSLRLGVQFVPWKRGKLQ